MLKEFKEFAMRGNVIDLAIGVVIGTAFGKIVSSLVSDIIMPPLGMLTGGIDFSNLKITLKQTTESTGAIAVNYGQFLSTILDFILIAFAIFVVVKQINRLKRKESPQPKESPKLSTSESLLTEIRDLLKKREIKKHTAE